MRDFTKSRVGERWIMEQCQLRFQHRSGGPRLRRGDAQLRAHLS